MADFLRRICPHFAREDVHIEAALTHRAFCYVSSPLFTEALAELRVRHRATRPYWPQTNSNAGRFIRTLLHGRYAGLYEINDQHRASCALTRLLQS